MVSIFESKCAKQAATGAGFCDGSFTTHFIDVSWTLKTFYLDMVFEGQNLSEAIQDMLELDPTTDKDQTLYWSSQF